MSPILVGYLLFAAGFELDTISTMLCIAKHESSLDPRAVNKNTDGSEDHGLFQINDRWWGKECPGDMFNPGLNTKCARLVYKKMGYHGWTVYRKGLCSDARNRGFGAMEQGLWYTDRIYNPIAPVTFSY